MGSYTTGFMTEPRITRLPSQAVRGNTYGRNLTRRAEDAQQLWEREQEAYLIDGWQDERPRV